MNKNLFILAKNRFILQFTFLLARYNVSNDHSTFLCFPKNTIWQTLQNTLLFTIQLLRSTQNTYHIATSWGLGTKNSHWGPGLENTVDAEEIRNPIHAFCSGKVTRSPSEKIPAIALPADCCVFGQVFTRFNPLFWPFSWFRSIVLDACFIHRHKSTINLFRIAFKIGQILLRSGLTNAFLVDWEQSRHSSCTELSQAQICMQNIDHTFSWDGYDLRYVMPFHFRVNWKIIMDYFDNFWCSYVIWTTWT